MTRTRVAVYVALVGLAVGILWLVPLGSSLWLDELETGWIVREGPQEALRRITTTGRPGSIPYMVGLAALVEHFGASELTLRLPSLLAMAFAAFLVARLGARLRDAETGLIAAAFFVVMPGIVFAASDARWYALALAADVAAVLALVHVVEPGVVEPGAVEPGVAGGVRSRARAALAWLVYALATTALIYLHSLWAFLVVVHAAYVFARSGARGLIPLAGAVALAGFLTLPILSQARSAERVFWAPVPSLADLAGSVVPAAVIAPVLLGVGFAYVFQVSCEPLVPARRPLLAGLLFWHAWPPLLLFGIARWTPFKIFVDRYVLCGAPGLALLGAFFVRDLRSPRARLGVVALALLFSLGSFEPTHFCQDFRGAIAAVNARSKPETTVLVPAMFFEGREAGWFENDPDRAAFVVAPVHSIYPLVGTVRPLPLAWSDDAVRRLEASIAPEISGGREFFLLRRGNAARTGAWLEGRLAGAGWRSETVSYGDDVFVSRFTPTRSISRSEAGARSASR